MKALLLPSEPAGSTIVGFGIRFLYTLVLAFATACPVARAADESSGEAPPAEQAGSRDYSEAVRGELGVNPLKQVPLVMLYRMDLAKNFDGQLEIAEIPDAPGADDFVYQVVEEARYDAGESIDLAALATAWHHNAPPPSTELQSFVIPWPDDATNNPSDPTQVGAGEVVPADGASGAANEVNVESVDGGSVLEDFSVSEIALPGSIRSAGGATSRTTTNTGGGLMGVATGGSAEFGEDLASALGSRSAPAVNGRRTSSGSGGRPARVLENQSGTGRISRGPLGDSANDSLALATTRQTSTATRPLAGATSYNPTRAYAGNFVHQFDVDQSGILERDEWSRIHASWGNSDRNGDGNLDVAEIAIHFEALHEQERSAGRPIAKVTHKDLVAPARAPADASAKPQVVTRAEPVLLRGTTASPDRSARRSPVQPRFSYFHYERIVVGMPPWFVEKDRDKDGQIMMHEYADEWTQTKVEDYRQYDLNNDGVITPAEIRSLGKRDE